MPSGLGGVEGCPWLAQADPGPRGVLPTSSFHQEEEPSGPSPDMPATAESSSSETDKEVLSPVMAAVATSSSMGEEPASDQAATPPVWERGGSGGTQQRASPAPDSGHPGPGPSVGPISTVSGKSEDLRPPRRRPPPGDLCRSLLGESLLEQ